jgi:hypothetical protein
MMHSIGPQLLGRHAYGYLEIRTGCKHRAWLNLLALKISPSSCLDSWPIVQDKCRAIPLAGHLLKRFKNLCRMENADSDKLARQCTAVHTSSFPNNTKKADHAGRMVPPFRKAKDGNPNSPGFMERSNPT